jgi:hypothetical protein
MRVLATIMRSNFASQMQTQQNDLTQWVDEILTGVWQYQVCCDVPLCRRFGLMVWCSQQANGTLLNYLDQSNSFADSSSTALLAATTFRYSKLANDGKHDTAAMEAFDLVFNSIDQDGWLLNTVDPILWGSPSQGGSYSPEGQSFVLLLAAAWAAYTS